MWIIYLQSHTHIHTGTHAEEEGECVGVCVCVIVLLSLSTICFTSFGLCTFSYINVSFLQQITTLDHHNRLVSTRRHLWLFWYKRMQHCPWHNVVYFYLTLYVWFFYTKKLNMLSPLMLARHGRGLGRIFFTNQNNNKKRNLSLKKLRK